MASFGTVSDERQKCPIEKRKRNLTTISPISRGKREISNQFLHFREEKEKFENDSPFSRGEREIWKLFLHFREENEKFVRLFDNFEKRKRNREFGFFERRKRIFLNNSLWFLKISSVSIRDGLLLWVFIQNYQITFIFCFKSAFYPKIQPDCKPGNWIFLLNFAFLTRGEREIWTGIS